MRLRLALALFLCSTLVVVGAATADQGAASDRSPFSVDLSLSGLLPFSVAPDSPTLQHYGVAAALGLELATPISVPIRLELGYIGVGHSRIASTGELYRGWEGARFALLLGYSFAPVAIGGLGKLESSLLGGGALTAAQYSATPLAYAYPSLVFEPRFTLGLGRSGANGLWLALPTELMFRAGIHTLVPGLSLGWRYRMRGAN